MPAPFHGLNKLADKGVVFLPANSLVPPANIDWTFQPFFVVRADIQKHGKAMLRVYAAKGGIQGHLADGDAHAAGALIAESKNPFAVAHDNAFHVVISRMLEDLPHAVFIRITQKYASGLSPYFAETLAAFTDRGGIYERKDLLHVADQQGIKKRFVGVLQITKKTVLVEGRRLIRQDLQPAFQLIVQAADVRRQQTVEVKHVAFVIGECRALIEARGVNEIVALKRHVLAFRVVPCLCLIHRDSPLGITSGVLPGPSRARTLACQLRCARPNCSGFQNLKGLPLVSNPGSVNE